MLVARVYTCPRDIIVNSMGKDVKNNCDNSDNNYFFFFFFFFFNLPTWRDFRISAASVL